MVKSSIPDCYEKPAPVSEFPRLPAFLGEPGVANGESFKAEAALSIPCSLPHSLLPSTQLHAVHEPRRRPAFELHAELQAALVQHVLDLGERLLAEIRRLEQLDFGLLHEVADVVDAFGLEAVGRTNREFEVVDRTQQHRVDTALVGLRIRTLAAAEVSEHADLVLQDLGRLAHGLLRVDRAVGLDVEYELVEVGALLEARALD